MSKNGFFYETLLPKVFKGINPVFKYCSADGIVAFERLKQTLNTIHTKTKFRPDIEGLRALAVIAVLAFHHKWASCFAGGFVGVDIFFVISGYLITKNIFLQKKEGHFSFSAFYLRRARRLFPALFFTVAVTVLIGVFVASPSDLQQIGESAVATIFSLSNFYFWSQSGYFDSAAIQKPLLHTWSLAVEEQFYLLWPVIIILLVRYCKNRKYAVSVLTIIGALSFFAAEAVIGKDTSGAFYLTPYRIGEFSIGAICAWLPFRCLSKGWIRNLLVLIGFVLIFYAIFGFTDRTRFPGLMALVPCLGTAFLIGFGENSIARYLLSNRLAVGIGRISYSLYLAHWPVYVFLQQFHEIDFGFGKALAFTAISLIVAIVMYRYIERPFRIRSESVQKNFISTRSFLKLFSGLTACLITLSLIIWSGEGWAWRFPKDIARFAIEAEAEKNARSGLFRERCLSNNSLSCDEPVEEINVFIIGDSHAPDAFNALATQYPQYHYVFAGLAGCPPLTREDYNLLTVKHPNVDGCVERNEKLLYGNKLEKADLVVINTVFSWYKPDHLAHSISQIRNKTSAPIIVLGNYMFFNEDVPDMVTRNGRTDMNPDYKKSLAWHSFAFDDELKALSAKLDFTYISKREILCKGNSINDCPLVFNNKLFTYDRHHLSVSAAVAMGQELKVRYNEIFRVIGTQKMIK